MSNQDESEENDFEPCLTLLLREAAGIKTEPLPKVVREGLIAQGVRSERFQKDETDLDL